MTDEKRIKPACTSIYKKKVCPTLFLYSES